MMLKSISIIPDDGISKNSVAFKFWKQNAIENFISYHLDSAWIEPDVTLHERLLPFVLTSRSFRDKRAVLYKKYPFAPSVNE